MNSQETIEIKVQQHYPFAAEQVFDAWLNPESARQWLFATPGGVMQRVKIDPKEGGSFVLIERRPEGDAGHYGRYLLLERPRRLDFSFGVGSDSEEKDRVSLEFESIEGGCLLTLRHWMNTQWADYAERTRAGWQMILAGLLRVLEG